MEVKWTYYVLPHGIIRQASEELEFRRLDNDRWVNVSDNPSIWREIETDGYSTSEEAALAIHEKLKKMAHKK